MTASARTALWAKAEALRSPAAVVEFPDDVLATPRAKAFALKLAEARSFAPAMTLDDIAAAPEWAGWTAERRLRLARLAGAVAVSGAFQHLIAGEVLLRAARALGAVTLDAVLDLPPGTPELRDRAAETGDADALARLGAAVLLSEIDRPALSMRLASRFEDVAPGVSPGEGRAVARVARRLFAELEAEAEA